MAAFNEKTTYQLRKEGSSVCISPKPTHHNENDIELNQKNDQAFTKDGGHYDPMVSKLFCSNRCHLCGVCRVFFYCSFWSYSNIAC
ncbi:hypothetical protein AX774_g6213 [Zancudomyces culisetae]|uniref:Uncharacterized protein n=1 Tax=Zancudomyces culisetae TaxID=1213189 RepID=A0A1R1PEA9_ZANCU|nr:hypothetical protein AX774_g7282 [Zancudomyces culisetae]OMH80351.1 hypothetical protein AX774_g6213 [Zancudomyces culisetae]|eukprot:OMH79307.1 hypothetical protein AX774_g7282 [Zancudomyces culisetae]